MKKNVQFLLVLFFSTAIGIGNVWADSNNYTKLKVNAVSTGAGYVYVSNTSTDSPTWTQDAKETDKETSGHTHYAWANACRGSEFTEWTTGEFVTSISDKNPYSVSVTAPTSGDGSTNTGIITANWITYKPCTVHLHSSTDGAYSIGYTYSDYNKETQQFQNYPFSIPVAVNASSQDVDLYYTDAITLTVNSGTLIGWYQNAECTNPLDGVSGSGPYTFVVPNNTESATERHIYPKFETSPKIYGKLNVKYAYASADGAGQLAVTDVESATPEYSQEECSKLHTSIVNDPSVPVTQDYYLYAKVNNIQQYYFAGWYSSLVPTPATLISANAEYTYSFNATSTSSETPTEHTVYAMFVRINTHYFEMTAEPATPGLGMVYVSQTNETNLGYAAYVNYSQAWAEEYGLANQPVKTNFYLYANPKYGYKFEGWYSDAACSTQKVSGNNPYTYPAVVNSTDPNNPDKAKLYAKFVLDNPINITFELPTGGSYSVRTMDIVANADGEYVWDESDVLYNSLNEVANVTMQMYPTTNLILTASPNYGNAVKKWKIAGTEKTSGSNKYYASATTTGKTYGVTFGASSPYKVGNTTYSTLDAAIANIGSNTTIIVVEDANVPAGEYTIPSGVTLLVPFDEEGTLYTTKPAVVHAGSTTQTVYRKLTLDDGAHLIISSNSAISVSAKMNSKDGGANNNGSITGYFGQIDMLGKSKITVLEGGNLYVWGYITGTDYATNGKKYLSLVEVESGAKVYEAFQFMDHHGGNSMSATYGSCFIINQYYIQSIEVPVKLHGGAIETCHNSFYVWGDKETDVELIGNSGLFRPESNATVTKQFDPINDRQVYDIDGNITMGSIIINASMGSLDSKDYILPLTNNMTININSGICTIKYDLSILAEAKVNIAQGATVDIESTVYIYDAEEWCKFGGTNIKYGMAGWVSPVPSTGYNGSKNGNIRATKKAMTGTMEDGTLCVNGTFNVKGYLMTTKSGANIYSRGAGKIILKNGGVNLSKSSKSNKELRQVDGTSSSTNLITTSSPQLMNGDGRYTNTDGDEPETEYTYFLGEWKKNLTIVDCRAVDAVGHTYIAYADGYQDVVESTSYTNAWKSRDAESVLFIHTANNCDWTKVNTVAGSTTYLKDDEGNYYEYSQSTGYWVPATQYTVTFTNHTGKTIYECTIFPNSAPTYSGATPVRPSDDNGYYTFIGWKKDGDQVIYATDNLPVLNANTTFVAQFAQHPYEANVVSLGVETRYETWTEALASALALTTTPTIMPLTDLTFDASQAITNSLIIDLNGHTLSGGVDKLINVNASGKEVSIVDNSTAKSGAIKTTGDYAVYATTGTLRLLGGKYSATTAEVAKGSATLSIKSGTFVHNTNLSENLYSGCSATELSASSPAYAEGYRYEVNYIISDQITIAKDETLESITVKETGTLTLSDNKKLYADAINIEASKNASGEFIATNENLIHANNVNFDYTFNGKAYVRAKQNWYAFAVPFEVDAESLQYKSGDNYLPCGLGTAIDIIYYDGEIRATKGTAVNAWKYVEDLGDKTLKPGTLYLATFSKDMYAGTVRFPKKDASALVSSNTVATAPHASQTGKSTDANWNGIANPALYYSTLSATGVSVGQIYEWSDNDESNYTVVPLTETSLSVGKPIFIQTTETTATATKADRPSAAPKRMLANTDTKSKLVDVRITAEGNNTYSDRLFVATDEEAKDEYTIGADLMKAGVASKRAQMWVSNYNEKLCLNTVAPMDDVAEYALGISVPNTGAYVIEQASENEGTLYLTQDGMAIWNLTDAACVLTLEAGTNSNYGLRFVKNIPGVVTNLSEAAANANRGETQKLIKDNHLLIINNGKVYDAQGAQLR